MSAEPATPSGDNFEALRAETASLFRPSETSSEPAQADAQQPAGEPAEQPGQQAAGESTSPGAAESPAPQGENSAYEKWRARYGGDPNRAAEEAFALEQRMVEAARKLKEYETTQVKAPEPQPQQQTQPEPAHPAPAEPQDIDTRARDLAREDRVCVQLSAEFDKNQARAAELPKELQSLTSEIDRREWRLGQVEKTDPLEAEELREQLGRLRLQQERLSTEAVRIDARNNILQNQWLNRYSSIKGYLSNQVAEKEREAAYRRGLDEDATKFADDIGRIFTREFEAQKLDPEIRDELWEMFAAHAARGKLAEVQDLDTFVKDALRHSVGLVQKFHRVESRRYAQAKAPESTPAAPAPVSSSANPVQQNPDEYLSVLRQMTRESRARFAR